MPQPPRAMRVFLSSTFRDMHGERNLLARTVFPRIRKICEARNVLWREVDLRWGVTEEQANRGEVVDICLQEIDRCRPYFVCMLGERYGWVPGEIGADTVRRWPWLRPFTHVSVTELEIRHAIVPDPSMWGRFLFYFRDPDYASRLPPGVDRTDFLAESAEASARQGELKSWIEDHAQHLAIYGDPGQLAEFVYNDLLAFIDAEFPVEDAPPDDAQQETLHEARLARLAAGSVDAAGDLRALDAYVAEGGPPIFVTGPVGSGKSTFLARWVRGKSPGDAPAKTRGWRGLFKPKWSSPHRVGYFAHVVGATAESGDWKEIARRLTAYVNAQYDAGLPVGDGESDGAKRIRAALNAVPAGATLVVVIDGIDHLDDADRARQMPWLPDELPSNVRAVISASGPAALDEIERRKWRSLALQPLLPPVIRRLSEEFLARYGKTLDAEQLQRLAASAECGNPMHLLIILEELRLHGVHETIPEVVREHLLAQGTVGLYQRVLARCESDFDGARPGLVRDALSLLRLSRFGLTEAELLDCLGSEEGPLPQALWSPVQFGLEQSIIGPGGLLQLAHQPLHVAVDERYLRDPGDVDSVRRRLANYLVSQPATPRHVRETAAQLRRLKAWDSLASWLSDLKNLVTYALADFAELQSLVTVLKVEGGVSLVDACAPVLERPADHGSELLNCLSNIYLLEGAYTPAARLMQALLDRFKAEGNAEGVAQSLERLSAILDAAGDAPASMALLKEQEQVFRGMGNQAGLAVCLLNQFTMLVNEDAPRAFELLDEAEILAQRSDDHATLSVCAGNRGEFVLHSGNAEEALRLFRLQEAGCRRAKDDLQLVTALNRLAVAHAKMGDAAAALAKSEESAGLAEDLGHWEGALAALSLKRDLHQWRGDRAAELADCARAVGVCRRIAGTHDLGWCLRDLALAAFAMERYDLAAASWREASERFRDAGDTASIEECRDQAEVAELHDAARAGDLNAAADLGGDYLAGRFGAQDLEQARRWLEPAVAQGHGGAMVNLASVFLSGTRETPPDVERAAGLLRAAAEQGVPVAMNNLASILEQGYLGAPDDLAAEPWYRKAANLGHVGAMNGLGWLYAKPGGPLRDDAEAMAWFQRAAAIGDARATHNLALMHMEGRGVPRNEAYAIELLTDAADLGFVRSTRRLAEHFQHGGSATVQAAFLWTLRAAGAGDGQSMAEVSGMYREGLGTPADPAAASAWAQAAAEAER